MIIHKDYKDKSNSVFMCDRCKTEISGLERITIYAENHNIKGKSKKWDFCNRCYRSLKKGIEEGGTNENTKNNK